MPTDIMSQIWFYSWDARSEYPYIMVCKRYPMTAFTMYTDSLTDLAKISYFKEQGYAMLFTLYMQDVKCRPSVAIPYISYSKCSLVSKDCLLDNGRVLYASLIEITLTNIDYDIICAQYKASAVAIKNLYIAEMDYLPEPIRRHVLAGYYEKCGYEERGEKGTYYYDRCKNRLNGNFGMMYTDPVRDINEIIDGEWKPPRRPEDIAAELNRFYDNRNNFLSYAWGVWTTAHARAHHQKLLDCMGMEAWYGDTDSGKGTDISGEIHRRIEALNACIKEEAEAHNAFYDMTDGTRLHMGVFVEECRMKDFRSLGAKKYAYIDDQDKLHVTISGVTKESPDHTTSAEELGTIDNFKPDFVFNKNGGKELRYNDVEGVKTIIIKDESGIDHEITYGHNISVMDSTYTIGISHDYFTLLKLLKGGVDL